LDVEQNQLCGFRLPLAGHVAFGLQSNHLLLLQLKIQTGKSARQTQNSFFDIFYNPAGCGPNRRLSRISDSLSLYNAIMMMREMLAINCRRRLSSTLSDIKTRRRHIICPGGYIPFLGFLNKSF
jgi:hypothetical protein